MIKIINLCKSFDHPVLEDLSLEIPEGTIFGLVGINGAGKSTLLKLMSGIMKPEKGCCLIDDEDVFENVKAKKQIFFLPDDPFYARNTTPKNLIELYQTFYDVDKKAYFDYLELFKTPLEKSMFNFSKGMKRQVFVALALSIKPKYLFLDEAFDGLDPLARMALKKELLKVQAQNDMTVVISSHSLRELEDICDSYGLLDVKRISASGDITNDIAKYHKYQLAFKDEPKKEDFQGIEFISYKQDKRFVTVVVSYSLEEMESRMESYHPLIIDEVAIDFEELFVIEVEARGYMKNE